MSRCPGDADRQFFCLYDPNQGGGVSRHAAAARLVRRDEDSAYSLQLFATARQLRSRENFTGFLNDVQPTGDPQRGDGVEQILKLDAAARLRHGRVELGLEVINLLDARYHEAEFYYVSNFNSPDAPASQLASQLFAAGAPRSIMASLQIHLGPRTD